MAVARPAPPPPPRSGETSRLAEAPYTILSYIPFPPRNCYTSVVNCDNRRNGMSSRTVSFAILAAAASAAMSVAADVPDLTDSMEAMCNPNATRWTTSQMFSRAVTSIGVHDGLLFVSGGPARSSPSIPTPVPIATNGTPVQSASTTTAKVRTAVSTSLPSTRRTAMPTAAMSRAATRTAHGRNSISRQTAGCTTAAPKTPPTAPTPGTSRSGRGRYSRRDME